LVFGCSSVWALADRLNFLACADRVTTDDLSSFELPVFVDAAGVVAVELTGDDARVVLMVEIAMMEVPKKSAKTLKTQPYWFLFLLAILIVPAITDKEPGLLRQTGI
jgi:hypothetical protein